MPRDTEYLCVSWQTGRRKAKTSLGTTSSVVEKWMRLSAVGFFLVLGSVAQAWERGDVLEAIHQVENPTDTMRVGRWGELGPFQFRPVVWRTYTQKPFSLAVDRVEAQAVAEMHFDWIRRGLERNKIEVSPYFIGLAWNAGLQATLSGHTSANSQHYAQRVANLVEHTSTTKAPVGEPTATLEKDPSPSVGTTL